MAEKYQTPVIVLMDLQLGMNKETVSNFDFSKVQIDRGRFIKTRRNNRKMISFTSNVIRLMY